MEVQKVDKPWGYEIIYAKTDAYIGKILHINKGGCLSLQYHETKDESFYVQKGKVKLEVAPNKNSPLKEMILEVGGSYHVKPGTLHRMSAIEESDILEVSTPHLNDIVRLSDKYGRV